jgi:putative transferase (TIGR04331 family)
VQNPQGGILLITYSLVRYSFSLGAQPTYDQWLSGYQPEQFRFVKALPEHLQHQVSVRLYRDYGNSQEARWQDNCPQVTIAPFSLPYETLLRENRLIVATYNATTFVETISLDIPTIVFWNPKHWELQPSAQPYFDRLKAVGIFHETPESAASKLAEVWDDVPGWWHQPDVQEALEYFRHRFARTVENPIQVLKEALSTVASWTVGTGT